MIGLILCGGKSTRMGTDKGLLKPEAKTWAQTAVDKIAELHLPVMLSVNVNQFEDYAAVFAATQLIKDDESLKFRGPLLGVLSAHLQFPDEDLLILACDMPLMEPELLKELLKYYEHYPVYDGFVYTNDGEPEPLCGIYTAKALSGIIQMYKVNQLSRHSMKFMLEHINVYTIPLPPDKKKSFRNFNAHAELNGL